MIERNKSFAAKRPVPGLTRIAWLGMLTSVCFLSALVLNFFPDQTALAGSFSSPAPVGGGSQLIYDLSIKVRPTDGLAFIAGSKSKVFIANTSNLAALYDINDSGSLNGTQWPSLTFGNDGRGYVAWRTNTSGWRGYMRVIPAGWNGGGLPAGFSLSDRISQATGLEMDQPSLAYSSKSNKLYVVGYFVTSGDATLGIVESSDGGNTFGNYKALINDPSRSNMTPEVCVDANDNIHVLSRINSQLDSISRINGVWDSSYTSLAPNGWDPRAADGRDTKQIVCAPDGTVYAVWKNNGDRSGSFGVSRRLPGQGWTTITTNLRPGANLSRVNASISPDGTLWVVMSSEAGYIGTWVVTSADKGASFSSPIAVYSRDTTANPGVAIDATGIGSKIHVATSFNGNIPESTFYSYADYTGPSAPPTVVKATATRFDVQPGRAEPGKPFKSQPVVTALDQSGNPVTTFKGTITLSLSANPVGGTLAGTTSATAVNGAAQFSNVQLDKVGWGYQLTATLANSDGTTVTGTSAPFMVSDVPPTNQRDVPIGLPQFQQLWDRSDKPIVEGQTSRSYTWGPSISGIINEPYTQGGSRQVQYFDKTRMEQTEGRPITNGLLAKELITGLLQLGNNDFRQYIPNNSINIAGDQGTTLPNPTYASFLKVSTINKENKTPEHNRQNVTATLNRDGLTGDNPELASKYNVKNVYYDPNLQHNIPDVFWNYMNQTGPVYVNGAYTTETVFDWLSTMGLPLSEAYWSRSVVGGVEQDVLVQVFERRVLTYTPANPEAFRVEMGNVGQHYRDWRRSLLLANPSLPS